VGRGSSRVPEGQQRDTAVAAQIEAAASRVQEGQQRDTAAAAQIEAAA
jgi:hypothetical protein